MLKIIVDGSADMPDGWAEKYQFNILPMPIQIGEKTYYQGVDITPDLFYHLVIDQNQKPQTAAPSPSRIKAFIEKVCSSGDTILSINVSSQMSATVDMVQKAASDLSDKLQMTVFDSGAGSAVLGFMGREARLLDQAGKSLNEIIDRLIAIKEKVVVVLTLDSLDFAYRSGRVGALKAAVTAILKIKPVISLKDGKLSVSDMVRTRHKSLELLVNKVKETFGDQKIKTAIVHSQDHVTAEKLKNMLEELMDTTETIITDLSISVAANLGPKTVGIVAIPEDL